MKYKVIKAFTCKLDRKARYPGAVYETDDPVRAQYLQNKGYLGAAIEEPPAKPEPEPEPENLLNEAEETDPEPKHLGGGWYALPDGRKVRKKDLEVGD